MAMNRPCLLRVLAVAFVASLTSCSDPVPPPSQGAWWVDFKPGTHGQDCKVQTGLTPVWVGNMANEECKKLAVMPDVPVDSVQHCGMGMDGVNDLRLACAVIPKGGGYEITGYAQQGTHFLRFEIPSITSDASATSPATGQAHFSSAQTVNTYNSSEDAPCNFYFNDEQQGQLGPGKAWLTFECPAIEYLGTSVPSVCTIQTGYVAFQNCDEE